MEKKKVELCQPTSKQHEIEKNINPLLFKISTMVQYMIERDKINECLSGLITKKQENGDELYYLSDKFDEPVKGIKFKDGIVFLYEGKKRAEHMVTAVNDRFGIIKYFQGEKGSEHLIREEKIDEIQFYEGKRDQEHLIRIFLKNKEEMHYYEGKKGFEHLVKIEKNEEIQFYKGKKGFEHLVKVKDKDGNFLIFNGKQNQERLVRIVIVKKNASKYLYEGKKVQEHMIRTDFVDYIQLKRPKKEKQEYPLEKPSSQKKKIKYPNQFFTPTQITNYEPKLDDTSKWLKLWHKAFSWVVSQYRDEWKEDRHLRLLNAQNKVENRKRDIKRLAADTRAKSLQVERDKKIKARELEISRHLTSPKKPIVWVKESANVSDLAIQEAKKKIAHEKKIEYLEEKHQREQLIQKQMAERQAALEVSRKLDESMRNNHYEVF